MDKFKSMLFIAVISLVYVLFSAYVMMEVSQAGTLMLRFLYY
jgi:hypothetical protein